jgi:hypothetical protein
VTAAELSVERASTAAGQPPAPVIVLSYPGSGADQLRAALSASRRLTCTSGTGLLPLCHQAVTTWQAVENRPGDELSRLATASVRALSAGLMSVILARDGGTRWCELATAPPPAAQAFLRVYPQTRYLTVYCRAETFLHAVLRSSPWGLAGAEFVPFVSAYPASTIAALAAYWASHTAALVNFEQAHPQSCLRIRIEDLGVNAVPVLRGIMDFIGLDDEGELSQPALPAGNTQSADDPPPPLAGAADIPLAQIPPPLLAQLNQLHHRLAYPAVPDR